MRRRLESGQAGDGTATEQSTRSPRQRQPPGGAPGPNRDAGYSPNLSGSTPDRRSVPGADGWAGSVARGRECRDATFATACDDCGLVDHAERSGDIRDRVAERRGLLARLDPDAAFGQHAEELLHPRPVVTE